MTLRRTIARSIAPVAGCILLLAGSSYAFAEGTRERPVRSVGPESTVVATGRSDAEQFCSTIADSARSQHFARRKQELQDLAGQVEDRLELLEAKRAELEDWLKRRESFAQQATDDLVEVYTKMRPDAAAERLALIEPLLASAMLMKIAPNKAGVILNEMEPRKAALVTGIIAAAAKKPQDQL